MLKKNITTEENIVIKPVENYKLDQEPISIYVNGIQIKTEYNVRMDVERFWKELFSKRIVSKDESEITIRLRQGVITKEILINGFIRNIIIGDWK